MVAKRCSRDKQFMVTADDRVCEHHFHTPELKQSIIEADGICSCKVTAN